LPTSTLTVTPNSPVFTGERVSLKCVIESDHSDWRYEWYKYSTKVSEGYTVNGNTLTIERSETSDSGRYTCKGHIDGRSVSSHSSSDVYLSVTDLPKTELTVDPKSPVFTGETVNLKCVIKSDHSHWSYYWRYEWYKGNTYNSVMLQPSERYTVNSDTLTIRGATESDQNQYWCRVWINGRPSSSQESNQMYLAVNDLKPKPELTSDAAGAALTENTVTLTCRVNLSPGWDFYWYTHTLNSETKKRVINFYRVKIDSVSDGGQYWCRAGRGEPVYYTQYSDALWVNVTVSPKAVVTVRPDERVFRGETVTLRCDIKWGGDTEWTYRWETEGTNYQYTNSVSRISTQELNIRSVDHFHSGKYTCTGQMGTQSSQRSDAVTLTVSAEAQAAVRVSPQPWLTEGDSVTLICEVTGSSTGWTFSWFRDDDHLSDSSRGAGGSYTLSPAALQHTGVYTCRAERGRAAYYTKYSNTQPLWITGVSASVSLVVSPSRSQHFSSDSLSLSCEDQSNSAGWTVRRYTDRNTEDCSKLTGSTCRIVSLNTSDAGVYWCQSESGEKHHPLNITVHDGDVILLSSVDPVIEGDTLTLHCLHRSTNSSILRADFYKDGSLVQNQTTGEMSITTVSKSHEGLYYCKTERGQSLHSWISVRAASSSLLVAGVVVGLSVCLLFFLSLLLMWRYKKNKDQQRNINQTSVPNQSAQSQLENYPLQSAGYDHIYDDVTEVNKRDRDDPEPLVEVTYSEVTVKKKMDKGNTKAESNNVTYSEVRTKGKKCKNKDINTAGTSDLTYAQINIQDKKNTKGKGKSSESGDTLYSELNHNRDRDADAGVGDATYALAFWKKNKTRP
ncbi:basement membrane-specific heparan sulfate proteoglycan core protein-like, partial [Sinocyclocheilus anshuiensis]|uniref:basement membrane-specific heparan sulfate proteoglycan core protein-like n=1 Tax=Sinocyclocheilus anshuiensis TaxID=1608454 RepID=UPI0007B83AE8